MEGRTLPAHFRNLFPIIVLRFAFFFCFSRQPSGHPLRNSLQDGEMKTTEPTDETLMMAYQHGEKNALDALVRRYADQLLGYLIRLCGNRQQAEDLFQETFLRVHRKAARYDSQQRFKPWLYSIATHASIDVARRRRAQPQTVSLDESTDDAHPMTDRLSDGRPDPAAAAVSADQREHVRAAVSSLPPGQRATLVMTYFEGMTYVEAAKALGCSLGTVKKQMSRALQSLARVLPEPPSSIRQEVLP